MMQTFEPPSESARFSIPSPSPNVSLDKFIAEMVKLAQQPGTPLPVANSIYAGIWLLSRNHAVETQRLLGLFA